MPKVALRADVNLILIALEGRESMLQSIFGGGDDDKGKGKKPKKMTADRFKRFAARHNERIKGGRK